MEGSDVTVSYLSSVVPRAAETPDAQGKPNAPDDDGPSFGGVLSALNPLQYLPVVGTIYRAVTGDTIPEGLRIAGSFVVSALTGGPVGMLLNAAETAAEKLLGIDPEAIAHDVAEGLGIAPAAPAVSAVSLEAGEPAPPLPPAAGATGATGGAGAARLQEGLANYARFAMA